MFDRTRNLLRRIRRRISEIGAAIVWPIEKAVEVVARVLFSVTEGVERAGGFFGSLVRWLTWPLRAIWSVLAALGRILLPEALRDWLLEVGDWFDTLSRRFFGGLLRVSEALNLDRLVVWLVWLLQPIWRPIAAMGAFVQAWFVTRNWRQVGWGLPALLMLLPFAAVWGSTAWFGNGAVISSYRIAVKKALDKHDYDRAQLYERKLAQLGVDTKLTEFRTALAHAKEEEFDKAYERMLRLAPEDRPGYPNAHYWIIQRLMGGQLVREKLVESPEEARSLAKAHIDHLESLGITGSHQQLLRALWLAQSDQLEEAAAALEPLVSLLPNAAFQRMRINLQLKQPEQARRDARSLVTHMTGLSRRRTQMTSTDFQWWLAAEEVLGSLEKMHTVLNRWRKLEPENEQARAILSTVYQRQAQQLMRSPLPDAQQIADLWLNAVELNQNLQLPHQMARVIYLQRDRAPIYGRVLEVFRDSPRTSTALLTALGTEAALAGRNEEALPFLAAAIEKDELNGATWNNYAYALSEGDAVHLDEALAAANRALEIIPKEYRCRETRGQILLRLGRWEEAIKDLEFALNGLPEMNGIHRSLATAYAALGYDELASVHRDRSN